MVDIKHGPITVSLPDHLKPPDKAGNMTPLEVKRIPKPRRGIGAILKLTATSCEYAGNKLILPPDITPAGLRDAATKADDIDSVVTSLNVIKVMLEQTNLLFDAQAWKLLRKVNDMVKAQGKYQPELFVLFEPMLKFLAQPARAARKPSESEQVDD